MQNNSQPVAKRWGPKRIIKYVILTPIVLFVVFLLGYYFVYTPIAKFFDHQNFLAAERDIDAIYNAIPTDEKMMGGVTRSKTCQETNYGFSTQEIMCTMEIKAKYLVNTPAYANEIADKYLGIVRSSDRIKDFADSDNRKSVLRKEFVRGGYAFQFKTKSGPLQCELIFEYANKDVSSTQYGNSLLGDVYLYPLITCYSPALDFWYEKVL
jgi:hypothetical protein